MQFPWTAINSKLLNRLDLSIGGDSDIMYLSYAKSRFLILDLRLSQQVCIHDHAGLFMIAWLYSFMDDDLNGSHLETVAV